MRAPLDERLLAITRRWRLALPVLAAIALALLWSAWLRGWVRFNYPSYARHPVQGVDVSHHQGAIDWARVILREDARTSAVDHAGEPWAVSLEQTRLDNEGDDPAWVAGAMRDAQARFNLRNLSGPNGPIASEIAVLSRLLCRLGFTYKKIPDGSGMRTRRHS
jgi:general secretion pathway protein K